MPLIIFDSLLVCPRVHEVLRWQDLRLYGLEHVPWFALMITGFLFFQQWVALVAGSLDLRTL